VKAIALNEEKVIYCVACDLLRSASMQKDKKLVLESGNLFLLMAMVQLIGKTCEF
jgi:hypothetical protein